jgi:hypothetical protein
MLGVVLTEQAMKEFKEVPVKFEFVTSDLKAIEPVVKHMHQVDLAEGIRLSQLAHLHNPHGHQHAPRAMILAINRLRKALRSIPDDVRTQDVLGDAYQTLGFLHSGQHSGDERCEDCERYYAIARRYVLEFQQRKSLRKMLSFWTNDPNTRCSELNFSFQQDIIGVLLRVKTNRERRSIAGHVPQSVPVVTKVDFRPYSLHSFLSMWQCSRGKADCPRFVPMIIDGEHGMRSLELLKEEMIRILIPDGKMYEPAVPLKQNPIGVGNTVHIVPYSGVVLPEFTAELALNVLSSIMNFTVVTLFEQKESLEPEGATNEKSLKVNDEALMGFMRFHHMLLFLAQQYPRIVELANKRVDTFISEESYRRKNNTPDLGKFLICLLLSEREWDELSTAFILEVFNRNVRWFTEKRSPTNQSHEQLLVLEIDYISPYRLVTTFLASLTSMRLVMFQVYFIFSIGRRAGCSPTRMLEMYNSSYGE